MQKIGDLIEGNNSVETKTLEERKQEEVEMFNSAIGELDLEDGINCPICKNKGFIAYLERGKYIVEKKCECMKQRLAVKRLNECGITEDTIKKSEFKNYIRENNWQETIYSLAVEFSNIRELKNHPWFFVGGQSGIGKTHLCTAIFVKKIKSNIDGEYMVWNAETPRLVSWRKSGYTTNQLKYDERMNRLKNVEMLYIDDFLKLTENKYNDDSLSLAYEILDYRYRNDKMTIISTEYLPQDINNVETSIMGRIFEKAGKYCISINPDNTKNYRFKEV